ncbi:excalibur calcium-binding domain-containing protein [Williamsia sp. 1135]|uniref:excalibur calcium-binding domain-containing protein n=1 Tax=Williamsia sp. 1135 TaxID=1889262 RepID=UPI001F0AE9E7|nr:excalibur calcium-binding domain-containing protein [Williamsia sp. 1135]
MAPDPEENEEPKTVVETSTTTKTPTSTTVVTSVVTSIVEVPPTRDVPDTATQTPVPLVPQTSTPVYVPPAPEPDLPSASFSNCTEAKAAGVAPIYKGEPGYSTSLDRDRDGIACGK